MCVRACLKARSWQARFTPVFPTAPSGALGCWLGVFLNAAHTRRPSRYWRPQYPNHPATRQRKSNPRRPFHPRAGHGIESHSRREQPQDPDPALRKGEPVSPAVLVTGQQRARWSHQRTRPAEQEPFKRPGRRKRGARQDHPACRGIPQNPGGRNQQQRHHGVCLGDHHGSVPMVRRQQPERPEPLRVRSVVQADALRPHPPSTRAAAAW